jgi:hypothetical protein
MFKGDWVRITTKDDQFYNITAKVVDFEPHETVVVKFNDGVEWRYLEDELELIKSGDENIAEFEDGPEFEGWEERSGTPQQLELDLPEMWHGTVCPETKLHIRENILDDSSDKSLVFKTDGAEHQPIDTKSTNPKDRAATTRLDLSLFPATARAYGALGMTEGDYKYGGYNYRVAGVQASVYYSAVNRHLDDWFNGEDIDRKTRVHHLASAIAGIGILIDAIECDKLNDDRPPPAPYRGLLTQMEERVKHLQETFPNPKQRYTKKDAK